MTLDALLRTACEALHDTGIPFMLTGSVATAFHGTSRATMDIDLVIDPTVRQLDALVSRMESLGAYVSREAAHDALSQRTMFNVIDPETGWKADLIIRKHRAFSETEFARRQVIDYAGTVLHVATVEDVILSKLERAALGGSGRQIEDVRALVRLNAGLLDQAYIDGWLDVLRVRTEWELASS